MGERFWGKGKLFSALAQLPGFNVPEDAVLICYEDFEETKKAFSQAKEEGLRKVLCFSPLIMKQAKEAGDLSEELGLKTLLGAVINYYKDLGTEDSYVVYSGSKEVYEELKDTLKVLGKDKFLSENIVEAAMMSYTAIGTHYGYVLSFYAGLGMCKRYEFPLDTYMYHTLLSLPPISEGAYRNVWGDFAADSDFSEFDDVIHAGEMLVRDMKKNGSIDDVYQNEERKLVLQKTLEKHWNDLMGDFRKLSKEGE